MSKTAIIAALDRELAPLVRNWQSLTFSYSGHEFRAYEHDNMAAVAGGVGPAAATVATRAMIARYHPQALISAGVAGALLRTLKVGAVITPNVIVDSSTGTEFRSDIGGGILVTASQVAGAAAKQMLVDKFHASAVDMEAAAVAEVAQQEGISFRCVKAISDEADFVMLPLDQFVNEAGRFLTGKFLAWAVFRPGRWGAILALARNTKRASKALCEHLQAMSGGSLEPQSGEMHCQVPKS